MPGDAVEPFADNWAYLRAELSWLDRVLSLVIARQRKESREVDRVAKNRADRVTSHWWKGLLSLDSEAAGDSLAEIPRRRTGARVGYQQQMDAKIQASRERGIVLGIPQLCDRLHLSMFEKNLLVMALAPEISRRYGRLYNYLQETEQAGAPGLPTVDLVLRILCRTDAEWRTGRQSLLPRSPLRQFHLLQISQIATTTFLSRSVKLADPLVDFLLAEPPSLPSLEALLQPTAAPTPALLTSWLPPAPSAPVDPWSRLILPQPLLASLKHLGDRLQFADQVEPLWDATPYLPRPTPGSVVLLAGLSGTGKRLAAQCLSWTLQLPLVCLDLAQIPVADYSQVLQQLAAQSPRLLLLRSAQCWLGRSAELAAAEIEAFLHLRRSGRGITFLSVERSQMVLPRWRRRMDGLLEFPLPNATDRLRLWQQAFPAPITLAADIDWQVLAKPVLTGGEIQAIAQDATVYAVTTASRQLEMHHLMQAIHAAAR